jgi:aspartate/methionine/tyrosine aminotransferase
MFSSRVPADLAPNPLSRAIHAARTSGRRLIDLTAANPTACGISYPADALHAMCDPDALAYRPQPLGMPSAREAVARDYARRGIDVASSRIVLTASTSEAYSVLFKLLCEPSGDAVMVPVPSYPLFDHLTRLDGISSAGYRLDYHGRWTVDFGSLEDAWRPRTRALLAVSPNNPTGSILTHAELDRLSARCAEAGAALILDEVFADYPLDAASAPRVWTAEPPALTFRLGGLSKAAGLPQVKLGWIAVQGPDRLVRDALDRIELVCDSYLSVSTPAQVGAPALIANGARTRAQILDRIRTNYAALRHLAGRRPSVDVLHAEGGWSAVLRVPARVPEEAMVLELLDRDGVIAHPGFFFDFPHEAFLVVSLLPEPGVFAEGVELVLERVDG